MKRLMSILVLGVLAIGVIGCSDASSRWKGAYGKQFYVATKSGGVVDGEWISTGTLETVENSDGWYFVDAETDVLQVVSGNASFRELKSNEVEPLKALVKSRNAAREKQLNQRLGLDNIK
jgi:hypothetical protein